ncbi:hypothetical protein [Shimia abyssi]|nr:hypothetical protein [Shimia abyssi]
MSEVINLKTLNILPELKPTFPKWNALSWMMLQFGASIKPPDRDVPRFGHLTRELSAISGHDGGVVPEFGLIDTRLDGPVEPLSPRFCR